MLTIELGAKQFPGMPLPYPYKMPPQTSTTKPEQKEQLLKTSKNGDQRQMQTLRDNKIRTKTQLRFTKGVTTQQQNFVTTNLHELMVQYVPFQHEAMFW